MDDKQLQELSEVVQSSNINILFGAGTSTPFLPLLGSIEKTLNSTADAAEKEKNYKKYLDEVMLPNKMIVTNSLSSNENYQKTKADYEQFFLAISEVIWRRKSTILSKQVNLFTTNVDIVMETVLEGLAIEYNDGFSGRFNPTFNLANYKKSINQRSLHFDHVSEIPVFNIIKLHGSLSWKNDSSGEKIVFAPKLEHIADNLSSKTGAEFKASYDKILVVNPEETKHLESVLNIYYSELLRMYLSELEKENATLFTVGFSMDDRHIKEVTLRAAKSNPTLRVFILCSQKSKESMEKKMELVQHPNIQLCTPTGDSEKFTLEYFTMQLLKRLSPKEMHEANES